jgi:signal transduction histidine kinase
MVFVASPYEALTRLGTFVLVVDGDEVIRWVSQRVRVFFREDATGSRLDRFGVESNRPEVRLTLRRSDGVEVPLRGDWISWGDEADRVFVGFPAPATLAEMKSIGLTLDDYLDHDSWLNYLANVEEAATAQADAAERIERLKRQHAEATRDHDKMRDARRASLNMMSDLDRSRKRAEEARAELESTQRQLMVASRQAGMAEIATGVLHNVGNVLNSVNVSAAVVADKLRASKVSNLAKAADLMREHKDDLGAFLTEDETGCRLPGYLTKLARVLADEQDSIIGELGSLAKGIDHIKKIVGMQQSHAGSCGVVESVSLAEVVEDALDVAAASLDRHAVEIVREYADLPQISLDRHEVLQIMVNLIRNAKRAILDSDREERRLVLRIARDGDARVRVGVTDTGVGISEENLTRIFSHGFTTKKDGHGFGLHSAALAAKQMGGSLTVYSDGRGKGATFALDLPIEPAEVTA